MRTYRLVALLALILMTTSCATKTPVGSDFAWSNADKREELSPDFNQPAPPQDGNALTSQEYQALRSSSEIPFSSERFAQEKVREQFLFLSRNVRFKMDNWIKRGERYLPHARQVFVSRGLPEDLIYLAFIESGYNPKAYSRSGAAGCWQFMPFTGRRFNLSVDWWMDERRDPYKAAEAAAEYLSILYDTFGDWELAVAAYNAGEGKIGRALKASGAKSFYELVQRNHTLSEKKRLREETLHYVPRFTAMVKIARNLKLLGFKEIDWNAAPDLQQVQAPGGTDLRQLARAANMQWSDFENHNPAFRRESTPPARSSVVYVPVSSVAQVQRFLKSPSASKYAGYHNYTIQKGDSWSIIAQRFGVDMATLKRVNNQSSNLLHPGQRIIVPTRNGETQGKTMTASSSSSRSSSASSRSISRVQVSSSSSSSRSVASASGGSYTVRSGDTMYSLSRRFGTSVSSLMRANGMSSARDLRAGMTLRIPGSASSTASASSSASSRRMVYRVRTGDTVWSIARNFKVSPYQLLEWNDLSKHSVIQPGDQISLYR